MAIYHYPNFYKKLNLATQMEVQPKDVQLWMTRERQNDGIVKLQYQTIRAWQVPEAVWLPYQDGMIPDDPQPVVPSPPRGCTGRTHPLVVGRMKTLVNHPNIIKTATKTSGPRHQGHQATQ